MRSNAKAKVKAKEAGPKYPDAQVQLTGENGNVFNVIGLVSRGLKRAGHRDAAAEFQDAAFKCGSYDEVLQLAMKTVEVS